MEQHELLRHVIRCIEKQRIPYFITGAVAAIAYGEPRLTNDIDIVAEIVEDDIARLKSCYPEGEFYFDEDAARDAVRRQFQFNIIHPGSGLKLHGLTSVGSAHCRRWSACPRSGDLLPKLPERQPPKGGPSTD